MEQKGIWHKILAAGLGILAVMSIIYFFVAEPQLNLQYFKEDYADAENTDTLGEMIDGTVVEQKMITDADFIKGISVKFANYGNVPQGTVQIQVTDQTGREFADQTAEAAKLPDSSFYYINFNKTAGLKRGMELTVTFRAKGGSAGAAVTLWAGRKSPACKLAVNGRSVDKTLVIEPDEYRKSGFAVYYWSAVFCLAAGWLLLCTGQIKSEKKGKMNSLTEFAHIFDRYKFLLGQLVGKEFKNKYRRSYLGMIWSLLSPLLMMVIVSSVFSFIFRFDIERFPVYLILGQTAFNFFSEATQVSVSTIVGSGQLIKKVYLPKYIFPLSKVLFSFVNFLISFIAAGIVMAYFGVGLNINIIFLPAWLIYYFIFTLGASMFLSALMVFLRDTQHLYSLVMVAFGYLTPVFYPVGALAPWMQKMMKLNPLYHYITFLRNVLLYGRCPSLTEHAACAVFALLSVTVGMHYFFKKQKKFILYI